MLPHVLLLKTQESDKGIIMISILEMSKVRFGRVNGLLNAPQFMNGETKTQTRIVLISRFFSSSFSKTVKF